jgi:hypothetical protein
MESNNNWDIYIGVAAVDKELDSRILKVYVKELAPFFVGALEDKITPEEYKFFDDISGTDSFGDTTSTNTITAEWFSLETNRVFPPDIRKGEQVFVFKLRDNDLYYWFSMGRDDNLRRLELHRIAISDDIACQKELDETNTYYFELDTLYGKRIRLVTNKSDGEDFKYEITIDAKNDFIVLKDDIGNEILLHSPVPRIRCINASGSYVDIVDVDINCFAPNDITLTAGNDIKFTAGNDILSKAGNNIEEEAGNDILSKAGNNLKEEAVNLIEEKAKNIHNIAEEKHVRDAAEIGDNAGTHVLNSSVVGVTGALQVTGMVSTGATFMGPIVMSPGPTSPGPIEL